MAGARAQRVNAGLIKNRAADFLMQGALAETRAIENMFANVNASIRGGRERKSREEMQKQQIQLAREKEDAVNRRFLIGEQNQNARFGISETRRAEESKNKAIRDEAKLRITLQGQLNTIQADAHKAQMAAVDLAKADDAIMKSAMSIEQKMDLLGQNDKKRKSFFGHVKAAIGLGKIPKEMLAGNVAALNAWEQELDARLKNSKRLSDKPGYNKAEDMIREVRIRKASFVDMLNTRVAEDKKADTMTGMVNSAVKTIETRGGAGAAAQYKDAIAAFARTNPTAAGMQKYVDDLTDTGGGAKMENPAAANQFRNWMKAEGIGGELYEPIAALVEAGDMKPGEAFRLAGSRIGSRDVSARAEAEAKRIQSGATEGRREDAAKRVIAESERQFSELTKLANPSHTTTPAEQAEAKSDLAALKKSGPDLSAFPTETLEDALQYTGNAKIKPFIKAELKRRKGG